MPWYLMSNGVLTTPTEPTDAEIATSLAIVQSMPNLPTQPMVLGSTLWGRFNSDQQNAITHEAAKQLAGGSNDLAKWIQNCKAGRIIMLNSKEVVNIKILFDNNIPSLGDITNIFAP